MEWERDFALKAQADRDTLIDSLWEEKSSLLSEMSQTWKEMKVFELWVNSLMDKISELNSEDATPTNISLPWDDEIMKKTENTNQILNKLLLAALGIKKMESDTEPFTEEERSWIKQRYEMEMQIKSEVELPSPDEWLDQLQQWTKDEINKLFSDV